MVQINFAQRQVNAKIVYYGPGMSGKTTNLEVIHQRAPENNRGDLTSISTDGDRTLFFDFMPLDLGTVAGMRTCFQIYTVPGQVYYNSTRKLVLQGVDGVVFVADSQASMAQENIESMNNLAENLREYGRELDDLPLVIQYNKRDLPDAMSVEELEAMLNPRGVPSFEAVANTGQGVFPTLKALAAEVLDHIHRQQRSALGSGSQGAAPASLSQSGFHAPPAAVQAQRTAGTKPTPSALTSPPEQGAAPSAPLPTEAPVETSPELAATASFPQPAAATPGGSTGQAPTLRISGLETNAGGAPATPQTAPVPPQAASPTPAVAPTGPGAPLGAAPGVQQAPIAHPPTASMAAPAAATTATQTAATTATTPHPMQPGAEAASRTSRPAPRTRVRTVPRPTPTAPAGRKGMWITALIVVGSVGIGAALGSFVLSLF